MLSFTGYRVISERKEGKRSLATLVARKCSYQVHKLQMGKTRAEVIMVEIISNNWLRNSVFILNIYSSPADHRQAYAFILAKALAKGSPLVVAGEFKRSARRLGLHQAMR